MTTNNDAGRWPVYENIGDHERGRLHRNGQYIAMPDIAGVLADICGRPKT